MPWLTWLLLEDPRALAALAFTVCFFLLVWWRRGGSSRPLSIGLLLSVAAFIAQAAIETHREVAMRLLTPIESEATKGEVASLRRLLAPEFVAGDLNATDFVALAEDRLRQYPLSSVSRYSCELVESSDGGFAVRCRYRVFGRFGEVGEGGFLCTVNWQFERRNGEWIITKIPPPNVQGIKFNRWQDVAPR
ncbi:MAG: hypothetical protein SF069_11945 [Phycisphaerae bacterium]|nr:hypothetical protein [Phycisphaerae bacterium]